MFFLNTDKGMRIPGSTFTFHVFTAFNDGNNMQKMLLNKSVA